MLEFIDIMLGPLIDPIIAVLYPQDCRVCGGCTGNYANGVACGECWSATRLFNRPAVHCVRCGAFLNDRVNDADGICGKCDDVEFEKARAAGSYEKALAAVILELKSNPHLPLRVRSLLTETFTAADLSGTDLIVPVPLSKRRFLERGFNQASMIARSLSKATRIPVDDASLVRSLHTERHRAGMDKKAREMSVKNAFAVLRPKIVRDRNILLVDDVLTSGATVSACAKTLKKSGARTINVLTIARAS